ncbi:dihydroorotate dehydrogenase (quinone), partial [Gammaproteobacteria bacterium]|nr:dihydroorotate dehydrogenase (quinone) [Gammaproteobacteria bacterium]
MGFNSGGLEPFVENLKRHRARMTVPVGANIGKNKITDNDQAIDDYLSCFNAVAAHADYITVNVSSPNTPGLRDLQGSELAL